MIEHNAARWLKIERRVYQIDGKTPRLRGAWYVVRTCPCHPEVAVTLPLASEERARAALRAMLAASTRLGT